MMLSQVEKIRRLCYNGRKYEAAQAKGTNAMYYLSGPGNGAEKLTNQQLIKEENIKCLFNLLNRNRSMARADMVRVTGLSPTTVSALVDDLVRENLVVETGYARTMQTGRKPINLRINASGRQIPVFSFSRWGVRYTLYNLQMEVLETLFVSHNADRYGGFEENADDPNPDAGGDYAAIIRDVLLGHSRFYRPEIALVIGICFPGIYLPEKRAFSLSAMHVSLSHDTLAALERDLSVPLFFGNSSQSLAYAEKKRLDLEGEETQDLIYVNVCEGVGAGILSGGEIFTGKDNFAGEIGHVSINYNGRPCSCGGRGCLEQYVNVDAVIERIAQIAAFRPVETLTQLQAEHPGKPTLEMIGAAYDAGEREIVDAINNVAAQLFAGIYSVVCVTGIRKVIIGGGIEALGNGFLQRLRFLAKRTNGNLLMHGLTFDYGRVMAENCGIGVAEYFIDKKFEIGRKPSVHL